MNKTVHLGTFIKTASPHIVEVLGTTALDFVCIDAEHAPFDRATLDVMLLAAKAASLTAYVRIADTQPSTVLSTLDLGAAGLLVPHIDTAAQAREIVSLARFQGGKRGYSSSPRFADYGSLSMPEALQRGDQAHIICQIESAEAVANAEAILAVDGVAGVFVGRADLALSMGLSNAKDPAVLSATQNVLALAAAAHKVAGIFVGSTPEREHFRQQGANWFVVSSDQTLLRQAAQTIALPPTEQELS